MSEVLLDLKNISKTFPGVKALKNIDFNVLEKEVHALVGENGAGKSTLIKILAGVYKPDEGGCISFGGKDISIGDTSFALKMGISVIYQDLSLFDNLSVAENMTLSYRDHLKGINKFLIIWKKTRETAKELLSRLGIDIHVDTIVGTLSIAQKQMIAIAKSLIGNPRLIIMDEPSSSLSSKETDVLLKTVKDLKKQGISIIYVSHKLEELYKISDRFTVIRDGGIIGTWDAKNISNDKLIHAMVGREVVMKHIPRNYNSDNIVVETRGLSKKGNFKDISFSVKEGEIVGFSGIVGAGRTELMETIFGITSFDSGTFLLNGKDVRFTSPYQGCANKLSFVPEDRKGQGLILYKSVYENINMLAIEYQNNKGFLDTKWMKSNAEYYMKKLDIRPNNAQMLTVLQSGGNQQKVVLAKSLSTSPKVLIIDEPTNGIDIGAKSNIHNLIRDLADSGIAIIVVSSDLLEILAISDRVIVMKKGRIMADLKNENLAQIDIIKYAI